LTTRRLWTFPLVVGGAATFFVVLLASALSSVREGVAAPAEGN
jgi:hypothetical protein